MAAAGAPRYRCGKEEDAEGNRDHPEDINNSHRPHHRPENLHDDRVDIEDTGGVCPEITIE